MTTFGIEEKASDGWAAVLVITLGAKPRHNLGAQRRHILEAQPRHTLGAKRRHNL